MISDIKLAAESVEITAVVTNSDQQIDAQLNRVVRIEDLPIMLVSWDLESSVAFDEHGLLKNPRTKVVLLLMTKADKNVKDQKEDKAEEMALLYLKFLKALYARLIRYQVDTEPPITDAGYTLVPNHGAGQHSGILGRFTMKTAITNCQTEE